ncbi:hypothetical protein SAMN05444380_106104 [Thermophagus xiamenensis]|uniref:Uncharacterized protein n=1 Tax=Thermophagus xiamenensis TaxID=385682 RepID=A0A1I1XND2_9BACT|nr:hypothetical protein SAMN05444380_106104 [Thermophagus xiamenensis]
MELAWLNKYYTCSFAAASRHARFIRIKFTYIISLKSIMANPHPLIP